METKYFFAENINKTGETGIVDISTNTILCLCTEEKSKIILEGLSPAVNNIEDIMGDWTIYDFSDMPKEKKDEIVKRFIELTAKLSLRTFKALGLISEFYGDIIDDVSGHSYKLSFTKTTKPHRMIEGFYIEDAWTLYPDYPEPPDEIESPTTESKNQWDAYRKAIKEFSLKHQSK